MVLTTLPETFAICRISPSEPIPAWAMAGAAFFSVTRTNDELSLVSECALVPEHVKAERGWCALKVEGPLDFALTGILHSLSGPLAAAKVSVFAVSTFDTDYLLVKDLVAAIEALRSAGHHCS